MDVHSCTSRSLFNFYGASPQDGSSISVCDNFLSSIFACMGAAHAREAIGGPSVEMVYGGICGKGLGRGGEGEGHMGMACLTVMIR